MNSARIIRGSFNRDTGVKGRALTGGGSISWETGALEIRGRLSRPVIRVIAGCLGVVLGLALVVGVTVALEQYDVIDFMRHRKGPVFVAFLALIAMGVGYGWIAGIADLLLGRRVVWTIPLRDVRAQVSQETILNLSWETDPPNATAFFVAKRDAGRLAELAGILEKNLPLDADGSPPGERAKPSPAAPGGARFDVVYVRLLGPKITTIKKVCEVTGWGLAKAKEFVETPPGELKTDLSETEAKELADLLKSDIEVTLRPR
ncbi:MAG: ribosomal protein L7/L12 [Planctomycetota bacterium]